MKKRLLALAFAWLAATACPVAATQRSVEVEWSYPESVITAGFRLYLQVTRIPELPQATQVCETILGSDRQMTCLVDIAIGANVFTLTAVDTEGVESPPSPEYTAWWVGPLANSLRLPDSATRQRLSLLQQQRVRTSAPAPRERQRVTPSFSRGRLVAPGLGRSRTN